MMWILAFSLLCACSATTLSPTVSRPTSGSTEYTDLAFGGTTPEPGEFVVPLFEEPDEAGLLPSDLLEEINKPGSPAKRSRPESPPVSRPTVIIPPEKSHPIYRVDNTPGGSRKLFPWNFRLNATGAIMFIDPADVRYTTVPPRSLVTFRTARGPPVSNTSTTTVSPSSTYVQLPFGPPFKDARGRPAAKRARPNSAFPRD